MHLILSTYIRYQQPTPSQTSHHFSITTLQYYHIPPVSSNHSPFIPLQFSICATRSRSHPFPRAFHAPAARPKRFVTITITIQVSQITGPESAKVLLQQIWISNSISNCETGIQSAFSARSSNSRNSSSSSNSSVSTRNTNRAATVSASVTVTACADVCICNVAD